MNSLTNRILFITAWISLVPALSSCTKDPQCGSSDASIIIEPAAGSVSTKGTVVTTAGLCTDGNSILVDAFLESANRPASYAASHYINGQAFTFSASAHKWSSTCQWVDNVFTNFWARYPSNAPALVFTADGSTDGNQRSSSFSYAMPSPTGVSQYARDCCPDLIYAYARKRASLGSSTADQTVKMKFKHVFSAICFQIGALREDLSISDITITGIYTSGTCNLTAKPSSDNDNNGDSLDAAWENLSGMDTDGLVQTITQAELDGGAMMPGGDKVFFLIPQTLGANAKVKINFMVSGVPAETYAFIGESAVTWKPGGRYVYRITFDNDYPSLKLVDISVDNWDEDGEELNANKEK